MKNGKNSVKRRDWKMATVTTGTQQMSTQTQSQHQQHSQHSNATVSSISISNGTVSNGTGVTISNLGNYNYYYTTANPSISTAAWGVYTNYMKPKTFKLR